MSIKILDSAPNPWGDYGDILYHGMSHHLGKGTDGLLQLERTGPYVPPISFPGLGDIVVTDAFRKRLELSGLTGISFRPIHKAKIVKYEWHTWNKSSEEPKEYPRSGEPEDYIIKRKHSPELARDLGELWELTLDVGAVVERIETPVIGGVPTIKVFLLSSTWTGIDLFRTEEVLYNYASEKAQEWFLKNALEYVSFEDCEIK